jgi:virginiamycin B lyase
MAGRGGSGGASGAAGATSVATGGSPSTGGVGGAAGGIGTGGIGTGGTGPTRYVFFGPTNEQVTPYAIALGPDGNIWTTDQQVPKYLSSFTPGGLPSLVSLSGTVPQSLTGLVTGPDHALWIANPAGSILRFDPAAPASGTTTAVAGGKPTSIVVGPDGALWFTDPGLNGIGRITTAGSRSSFPIPTAASNPQGIAAGPDGSLWFVETDANQIGRITTTGAVTEFAIPTAHAAAQQIAVGPDAALWFTERDANQLGRITTAGVVTELPILTPNTKPVGIVAGPDLAVWFTETANSAIGRMTTNGAVTEFPINSTKTYPFAITVGADGDLWFSRVNKSTTDPVIGSVARLTPESKPFCALQSDTQIFLSCSTPTSLTVVNNTGQTPTGTISVSFDPTNPNNAGFQLGGTCAGASLNPGEQCTVTFAIPLPANGTGDDSIIVRVQPQLGDLYEIRINKSGCPIVSG